MTTPEKAEPERSAISSTDCRHCLTHPLPGPHTDGKCCLCGITREELEKPKKCGYDEHDFKPFQGYRDEPGEPHCLTCGHTQSGCGQHLAEKPDCEHPNKLYTGSVYNGPAGRKTFLFYTCPDCKVNLKEEELDGFEKPKSSTECEGGCRVYTEPPCTPGGTCICGGEWWKHGCKHSLPPRRCTCGPDEACGDPCTPSPVDCAHVGSRVIERSDAPEHWTRYLCDDCGARWIRNWSEGGEKTEEPPLTPEEEEELSLPEELEDCVCGHAPEEHEGVMHQGSCHGIDGDDDEAARCGCPAWRNEPDFEIPPQPDRRPPYLVAYSVQGHLYEVALPGDATVAALDGRLVITHQLGPVAGICQIAPITNEESAR